MIKPRGSDCSKCPLRDCPRVIPTRPNSRARLVIIGEAPGRTEVEKGHFFAGATGNFVRRAIREAGLRESQVYFDNALCCWPTGEGLGLKSFFRDDGTIPNSIWAQALRCCRGHLIDAKSKSKLPDAPLLLLGKKAAHQLIGSASITPWLGAFVETGATWRVSTLHPAYAMRKGARHYLPVIYSHILKACHRAAGKIGRYQWSELVTEPNARMVELLRSYLLADRLAIDTEDVGDTLLCLGISDGKTAVSIPWDAYYPRKHDAERGIACYPLGKTIIELASQVLASKTTKVFHFLQHDLPFLQNYGFTVGVSIEDTLVQDSVLDPEVPHSLGFLAQKYLSVPAWKAENKLLQGKGSKVFLHQDPSKLRLYNAKDAYVTARLDRLQIAKFNTWGRSIYEQRMAVTLIGLDMTREGLLIDKSKMVIYDKDLKSRARRAMLRYYRLACAEYNEQGQLALSKLAHNRLTRHDDTHESRKAASVWRKALRDYTIVNIRSGRSISDFFFRVLNAPIRTRTPSGIPAIDDEALTWYIRHGTGSLQQAARYLARFRRWSTLHERYIKNMPIRSDGRIHPVWRPGAQLSGRWSSGSPNMGNIPKPVERRLADGTTKIIYPGIRELIVAPPGCKIVKADYNALELKVCALYAGATLLLNWFAHDIDVHTRHAQMLFYHGDTSRTPSSRERTRVKNFCYNVLYLGSAETIWRLLVTVIPELTLQEVRAMMTWFFETHPQIKRWQERTVREASRKGYSEDLFSGRRRYTYGQVEPTEAVNFPIQSTATYLADTALQRIVPELHSDEHIVIQLHDELVAVGPDPNRLVKLLKKHMEQTLTLDRYSAKFTVECKVGDSWGRGEKI